MRLDQLLAEVDGVTLPAAAASVEVSSVTHDSRRAGPGTLFCCVPGANDDGHRHAPDAVARGAAALLVERPVGAAVPEVRVPDARAALGPVAATFWGHPSRSLRVVGVTGTNGKTTTVHLLQAVLEAHGWPTGTIGTLTGARTTPEATDLQALLAGARDQGRAAVAMEVSSHALALHRADATCFALAVFTNLSPEHLDFHRTMEAYFAAKAHLFERGRAQQAVVNADDRWGRKLLREAAVPTVGFSLAAATELEVGAGASTFRWEGVRVRLPLGGRMNVVNALAAATAARRLGVPPETVAAGLAAAGPVPGRFEPVDVGQPFAVVVDYAHTPDGLEHVLSAAREAAAGGRVLVVFGAGGRRDPTKRPLMGAVAARLADVVVLTADNPRGEDPETIAAAVRSGMGDADPVVEVDRRAAIALALGAARPGDVVVIAGKGHETTQQVGDVMVPFDDRVVARELLEATRW